MKLLLNAHSLALSSWLVLSFSLIAAEQPLADIKPPLEKEGFDEEQMRLARVIHKRIVDYQQANKQTRGGKKEPFAEYEEALHTGVQFDMLPVKGGSFTWKGEEDGDVLEVTLSPFWMAKAEVTWEEYEPFMLSEIPRQKDGQVNEFIRDSQSDFELLARPTPPHHPMTFGMTREGRPALSMTQHAANKYCQWLSYQTGHFYRLPTEAEWEYVSRAGSQAKYSWGDDPKQASEYAWFGGDASSEYKKPGQKKPNAWGFLDMHGNVMEWTLDQFVPNRKKYFGKDKVLNPWVKATEPYPHVTKGGHWKHSSVEEIQSSARYPSDPNWKIWDPQNPKSIWYHTSTPWLGFRVVRPVEIPTAEEMYHYWNSGVENEDL